MLCRPSRGSLIKWLPAGVAAALLVAPAGCSVGFTTSEPSDGSPTTYLNDFDAGEQDGAADSAAVIAPDGGVLPYRGSPLCNWSTSQSACNPDQPTTLAVCDPKAPAYGDASAVAARCYVRVTYQANAMVTDQGCGMPGTGGDGAACQTGADCAAGFECVGAGICRHYCCDLSECEKMSKLTFCDVQTVNGTSSAADTRVPVCMPVQKCNLLLPGCGQGETCAPVRTDTTSCVAIGPAQEGASCERDHCAEGLACLGAPGNRICYQLCHTDSTTDCANGMHCKTSSALFTDPTIGVCQ
jgi:hypothetical protein